MVRVFWDSYIGGRHKLGIVGEHCVREMQRLGVDIYPRAWNCSPIFRRFLTENRDDEREEDFGAWWDLGAPDGESYGELLARGTSIGGAVDEVHAVGVTWGPPELLAPPYWRHVRAMVGYVCCHSHIDGRRVVDACNACDMLFVPSSFVRQLLEQSDVRARIELWPHGVDAAEFCPALAAASERGVVSFLVVAGDKERKNVRAVLRAFGAAFDRSVRNARLVVHSQDQRDSVGWMREFPDSRIIWRCERISRKQMIEMHQSVDCLVCANGRSAFGLTALEALACGVPVLYATQGGHCDFCSPEVGYPVPVVGATGEEGPGHPQHAPALEQEALVDAMRQVYSNRSEARRRGARGRMLAQDWSWRHGAARALAMLDGI